MNRTIKTHYIAPETAVINAETTTFICVSVLTLEMAPQVDQYVYEEAEEVTFE